MNGGFSWMFHCHVFLKLSVEGMDEELRNVWAINGDISYLARPNMLLCMVSIGLARFSKKHGRTQQKQESQNLDLITWYDVFLGMTIAAIGFAPNQGALIKPEAGGSTRAIPVGSCRIGGIGGLGAAPAWLGDG
jgi:hypothetical protein